jgi:hypothetical protein
MYNKEDAKNMRACLDKGIKVVPIPLNTLGTELRLEIHRRGKKPQVGKGIYTPDNMTQKITELYRMLNK